MGDTVQAASSMALGEGRGRHSTGGQQHGTRGRAWETLSLEPPGGPALAETLILDFCPPEHISLAFSCPFLLQGIFATQGLNPGLLHCRQVLYCLGHHGSPL